MIASLNDLIKKKLEFEFFLVRTTNNIFSDADTSLYHCT